MRLNQIQFEGHPLFGSQVVDLRGGRIFAICGKNGVGKTTFLESLGFRLRPTAFDGVDRVRRKPFLKSVIDFNEDITVPISEVPQFHHSVKFYINRDDFSIFSDYRKNGFRSEDLANYEFILQDDFLADEYDLCFKNTVIPHEGDISFMPVMRKKSDGSTLYAFAGDLGKFFHCVDVNPAIFFGMSDWKEWFSSNISALVSLSGQAHLSSRPDFPALLMPVVEFLAKFQSAWNEIESTLLAVDPNSKKKNLSVRGIQDAFLRELSKGQLRMLLTIIEIEKFNKSKASFLVFEEPEQNFDPVAQKFLLSLYESMIKPSAQVFLTTHSPHLLSYFSNRLSDDSECRIFVLKHSAEYVQITSCANEEQAFNALPQIFDIYTEDVFIRLYAMALSVLLPSRERGTGRALGSLIKKKIPDIEMRFDPKDDDVPLPVYVRNAIHHPENVVRSYNSVDLKKSVEALMRLLITTP